MLKILFIKSILVISQHYQKSRSETLRVPHKVILQERKGTAHFNENQCSGIHRLKTERIASLPFSDGTGC